MSTQVNSMPNVSNKQKPNTPDITGETGVSFEQEFPENESSGTGTREILGRTGYGQRVEESG